MNSTLPFEQRRAMEKGKFGNLVVIKLCRRGSSHRSTQKIQHLNGVGTSLVQFFSAVFSL